MLKRDEFLGRLRGALNHLYDPPYLRRSLLASALGLASRFDAATVLQRTLIDAIEALAPRSEDSTGAQAWRVYNPLHCRYVEQLSQQEVADQMGVSTRHLRRMQRTALNVLADRLWGQFAERGQIDALAGGRAQPGSGLPTVTEELAWLKETTPETLVDLQGVLTRVQERVGRLATHHRVPLEVTLHALDSVPLPDIHVRVLALEQALLNLASIAIRRASAPDLSAMPAGAADGRSGGGVQVCIMPLYQEIEIRVQAIDCVDDAAPCPEDEACWVMALQLAALCGGRLTRADGGGFDARLALPAIEKLQVLAIDDNADTLQLFQRYTSGTRFHLTGARDPQCALDLAARISPRVLVVDVMMPQIDGWELLARLRQHPNTSHIPVVVCTILPQEELAISMGASDYVRKPVTREAFLAALDRQVETMAPGCQ